MKGTGSLDGKKDSIIDCHRCRHYYVTWERQFPHGCRAMHFKSRSMPSSLVKSVSGPCLLFVAKFWSAAH